jgi:inorganic pyrophosphatase
MAGVLLSKRLELMSMRLLLIAPLLHAVVTAQGGLPPRVLPATATTILRDSLAKASPHATHVWRDTVPINTDQTVNGYIEIAKGDRRKWEFDMGTNIRAIDRVMPADVGGYPVNYGFVPQTVSYDGDPFDVLVLGPALPGGQLVRGVIVGVMFMDDEKGLDSKVVLSPTDASGRRLHALSAQVQREIGDYFARYKKHQPGAFSNVPGWGSVAEGLAYVTTTQAYFRECRNRASTPCAIYK